MDINLFTESTLKHLKDSFKRVNLSKIAIFLSFAILANSALFLEIIK